MEQFVWFLSIFADSTFDIIEAEMLVQFVNSHLFFLNQYPLRKRRRRRMVKAKAKSFDIWKMMKMMKMMVVKKLVVVEDKVDGDVVDDDFVAVGALLDCALA